MRVLGKNNVQQSGLPAGRPLLFAHGFGCDQNVWRLVAPGFERDSRIIRFDHVGAGGSDLSAYDRARYASLQAYAEDLLDICRELDLHEVVLVGHSVGATIGVLAANQAPERFARLVLVAPSPRYLDDDGYTGGFSREDIGALLDLLDTNYLGWSSAMAPRIMANPERPELGRELTDSFCRTQPEIAKQFARVTFLSDHRAELAKLTIPSLILQCSEDVIAPRVVGEYMHRQMTGSELVVLRATGHCPHLSAPEETIQAIRAFLDPAGSLKPS